MNLKLTAAIAAITAMTLSGFAQGGPGPGGPGPGFGGPGGPGMGGPGRGAPVDWSKLPQPSDKKGVTYAMDIKPLLDANCIGCHGGPGGRGGANGSGGVNLTSLTSIMAGRNNRGNVTPLLVAGKSADSDIVKAVSRLDSRSAMPQHRRGPGGPGGPGMGGPGAAPANTNAPATTTPQPKDFTPDEVGLVRAWIDQGAK